MTRSITNYQPIYCFGKQGIMTNYLPVYLAELENRGYKNITAHVKKINYASKKLLKRNGFFKFNQIRDVEIFLLAVGLKVSKNNLK